VGPAGEEGRPLVLSLATHHVASRRSPPRRGSTGPRRVKRFRFRGPKTPFPGLRSISYPHLQVSVRSYGSSSVAATYSGPLPGTLCYDGSCQQAAPGYYTAPAEEVVRTWTTSYPESCPPGHTGSVTVTERWRTVKYWTPNAGGLSSRGTLRFTSATRDEMEDRTESWNCQPIDPSTSTQTTETNTQTTQTNTTPPGPSPTDPPGPGPTNPPGPGPTTNDNPSSSENNNDSGGGGGGGSNQWIDPSSLPSIASGYGLRHDRFRSERSKPRYLLPLTWTLDTQL
jgi:hypothetical protein